MSQSSSAQSQRASARTLAQLLTSLVIALVPVGASAQDKGFYPEHFEPLPSQGLNLLNLGASRVLGSLEPSAGLFFQYLDDPLQLVSDNAAQHVVSRLITHQLKADLWIAMGFANVIDVGVVLPLVLNQAGQDLAIFSRPGQTVDAVAMGDVRIVPKLELVDPEAASGFGLAVLFTLSLPTGSEAGFSSDGAVRFEPRVVFDWTDGASGFSVVGNLGYHFRPKTTFNNLVVDDAVTWGAGVRVPTPLDALTVLGTVFGSVPLSQDIDPATGSARSDGRATPVELDAGLELTLGDFVAQGGVGVGLTQGFGAPDFRLFLSAGYVPRCIDNDHDGICNGEDACKNEPEDFDGFQDGDGCPDPDNDQDGVPDVSDGVVDKSGFGACRDAPEDQDGYQDEDGCPDPDNDGDGILDVADGALDPNRLGFGLCRDAPEDRDGYQDGDGCPEPDNDGDGVADERDGREDPALPGFGRCRGVDLDAPGFERTREDVDGFEDADGCPDPDNDKDGVPDVVDGPPRDPDYPGFGVCRDGVGPTEGELVAKGFSPPWHYKDPETVWPGCKAVPTPRCQCGKLEIPFKINFKYGKWSLTDQSMEVLDQVATLLGSTPCISRLRVEGHTDWHGPDQANDALSDQRARSVVDYLVSKGLDRSHFETAGYGARWPIDPSDPFHDKVCRRCSPGCTCEVGSRRDPNPSEAQIRAENRRSVFRVLELQDPDGTVKQCKMPYAAP